MIKNSSSLAMAALLISSSIEDTQATQVQAKAKNFFDDQEELQNNEDVMLEAQIEGRKHRHQKKLQRKKHRKAVVFEKH